METNPTAVFKEAKKLISLNRLNDAKILLQPLISELRNDHRVYSMLGFIYHRQGEFARAIKNYKIALELNAHDVETAINLSLVYNDLGRYEQGSELYTRAINRLKEVGGEKEDRNADAEDINSMFAKQHASIGELYLRYNRTEDALREFEKALTLLPTYYPVYAEVAECYSRMGKRKQAIKELKALKLKNPQAFDARIKLGHLLFLEGEVGPAIEEWDGVLRDNPENMEAKMYIKMAQNESLVP